MSELPTILQNLGPIQLAFGLLPVILFLLALVFLDSFKLVRLSALLSALLAGGLAALLSLLIFTVLQNRLVIPISAYSRYLAPPIEETLKAAYLIYLIRKNKIGFFVDGAILGFAVGTGFALLENLYYLDVLPGSNPLVWLIRGFGTAVMHGSTTATFALISLNLSQRHAAQKIIYFLPGWLTAVFLHGLFNHFFLPPVTTTLLQITIFPLVMVAVYQRSEKSLREWLEIGMDVDVWLLEQIQTGHFADTKIGRYVLSLKEQFSGEVVADLFCYIRLHLELALRAKGILMMRENGFDVPEDPEIREKFTELAYLENSIGKTGRLALAPILNISRQELWQIYFLGKK